MHVLIVFLLHALKVLGIRKDIKPGETVFVDNIERDVDWKQPHVIRQRIHRSGGQGSVDLVEKGHQKAARKNLHKHVQEEMLDESTNLLNAEYELLRSVSGLPHMPEFIGSAQAKDIFYMYYRPWCDHSLHHWLYKPPNLGIENTAVAKEHGAQWMLCLTRAAHSLHTMQPRICHRDINPRNIMITGR